MASKTNLKLPSFDGGGIRGLSQLEIMNHIMHQLTWDEKSNESDEPGLPCEHFDLLGGSGAGGLIAILFGKLRMSVEEASEEFYKIIEHVFNPKRISAQQRTEELRKCIEGILEKKGLPVDLRLTAKKQDGCASFVVVSPSVNAKSIFCLRTYPIRRQPPSSITVVEAVLATCATQPEFAPVSTGSGHKVREYIAASGAANPIHEVIAEAHLLFGGDANVASLLSLGTGNPGIAPLPQDNGETLLYKIMRDTMHDCEQRAQEVEERIGRVGIYSRFSVDQGMQNNHLEQVDDPHWITAQTEDYLSRYESGERLELLVHSFGIEKGPITLEQLKHAGGSSAPGHIATVVQKSLEILISNQDDEIIATLKPQGLERESQVETCLEGTRQDILEKIRSWVTDLEAPNILWIHGYPGAGKSAIACTVAEELRSLNRLGSSFFFQREKASVMTPNALWRTVAYDLSRRYTGIRNFVVIALNTNESLPTTPNVDDLFRELISQPLTKSDNIPTKKLPVVILDALDECGGIDGWRSGNRKNLMRTLKDWSKLPSRFKLIVTSRRENDIEQLFSNTAHHPIEIVAGDAVTSLSFSDIKAFLLSELRQLQARYPSLPFGWPGEETILWLIDRARGLFIWIKTVIKLLERGEPRQSLRQVLSNRGTGGMADLYTWILDASFPSPSKDDIKNFRAVLGAIIFTKEPLSIASLPHFLSMDGSTLEYVLAGLKSVLYCGNTVRVHHQSFVDFLLNPEECPSSFLLNQQRETRNLALCCLNTMKLYLRFNICDFESSYVRNQEVPNLAQRVDQCIPPYLSYSSRYWATHLTETSSDNEVYRSIKYFMDHQFLSWLETMSLIKQINSGSSMLWSLENWLRKSRHDCSLARDMQKFFAAFASVISQSAPHIYISALPFAPRSLGVSKQYMGLCPQTLVVKNGGYNSWPAIQGIFTGHKSTVASVAFSPDGRRIVSGSDDHTIRVWDAETGETAPDPLQGHSHSVNSVSFSLDGERIVSGSWDHTIRVWDAETGETILGPLQGHSHWVSSVSFSPDGKRIVSGSSDHTIRVWDAKTGDTILSPLQGHSDSVWSVRFSPDGKRIVSGSEDQTVRIWDTETGKTIIGPLEGHSGSVSSVSFSPDGQRVVSGSSDHTIRIWDAEAGKTVVGPLSGHIRTVWSVLFSLDGRKIVSGSSDHTIRVWDAKTGETVLGPLQGHTASVWSVSFSLDGRRIVSGSEDNTIRVWNAETGKTILGPFQGHSRSVLSVSFSPDGRKIVSGSWDDTIQVWDADTGRRLLEPLQGHRDSVWSVSFSPDGTRIVSGSEDHTIRIWNAETGKLVLGPLEGHSRSVWSVSFSPNGKRLVSGSRDHTIRVWSAETGKKIIGPLQGHSHSVNSVSFSPDGRRIVSGSRDHTIRVWDAETGETLLGPLLGHRDSVWSVSFSPDGTRILSGSDDHTIRVWDAQMGKTILGPLLGHRHWVWSISFSPDGKRIVSGSSDHTVRVWDAQTGEMVLGPLRGHVHPVYSVSFSPDGNRIVSGSWDDTIRVWDARTSEAAIGLFQGQHDDVKPVPTPSSGKVLASGSGNCEPLQDSKSNGYLTDIFATFRQSAETKDGWIRGPNSELLFWVPPQIRPQLCLPGHVLVIDRRNKWTTLDLTRFVHGKRWSLCRGPVPEIAKFKA